MKGNQYDVDFDFASALQVARQLWHFSDRLYEADGLRRGFADEAMVDFAGAYAAQFAQRQSIERQDATRLAAALRNDALNCARLWKEAMDEQNRRLYARHVDQVKAERSTLDKVGDYFTGFEFPSRPSGVPLPVAPAFVPTATFVRYPS